MVLKELKYLGGAAVVDTKGVTPFRFISMLFLISYVGLKKKYLVSPLPPLCDFMILY